MKLRLHTPTVQKMALAGISTCSPENQRREELLGVRKINTTVLPAIKSSRLNVRRGYDESVGCRKEGMKFLRNIDEMFSRTPENVILATRLMCWMILHDQFGDRTSFWSLPISFFVAVIEVLPRRWISIESK